MLTNEKLQSKTISFLRFPLIVGVVLIHTQFADQVINGVNLMQRGDFPVYTVVCYLFSTILSRIAVPLFFFIAGFLFFYKVTSFTARIYCGKLKKRAKTILIPYIFWNLLVILFLFLSQIFFPGLMSGRSKLICEYSFSDWLWAFWNSNMINLPADSASAAYPICYQFWFIRDLMVVMLFSPLVYWLVKKLRQYVVVCLGMLWLFDWWVNVAGFSLTALFFFSFGAYFSIHKKHFTEILKPLFRAAIVLYTLLVLAMLYFRGETWCHYLHAISILVGLVLAITLSARLLERGTWHANSFLSESSFFIYAYHGIFLAFLVKILLKIMRPHTDGAALALYILCPTIIIFVGLGTYYLLKRYLPTITSVITGGR